MTRHSSHDCSYLNLLSCALLLGWVAGCATQRPMTSAPDGVTSPDGGIVVGFQLTPSGEPRYQVRFEGEPVLQESALGLVAADADFTRGLKLLGQSPVETVRDDYEILTAKRRVNSYRANRRVYHLATADGNKLDIIFQVSNDGVAFRYAFPKRSSKVRRLTEEVSSFHFLPGTKAWLQPMAVAKSGWEKCNPSYEEYFEMEIPAGKASTFGAGWVFPALFRSGDTWVLLSETAVDRNYCGARLRHESPDGEYRIGFPDPREGFGDGPVNPESTLPWIMPWRLIVIGSLKTVAESMLGVDLAMPPAKATESGVQPGKASWSWPLLGDGQTVYDVQSRFIDYAAEMKWRYCLIDSMWDQQIGYDKIKELIDYAAGKNVKILLWYNSAGDWNTTPQTPRNKMLTREGRLKEFERLKAMGVAGLKIDFFGGDGQSMIAYYHDILEDAAPYGFAINFHGCTLPRGWQRTYPHLMTMEAIRGLEFVTFEQANADRTPPHCTMLPFTRNVFDPMDFTPMVLDRINRIERRSTSAFELALAVVYTSGIQHYAEIPDGMAKAPDYVKEFIKGIPSVWDEVRFLDGYPGRYVVMARNSGGRWYIGGINGEATSRDLTLDLRELSPKPSCMLITDGDGGNLSFRQESLQLPPDGLLMLTLRPNGGFVLVAD